jgi:nucleoside 2-deoxyribosyltransferase
MEKVYLAGPMRGYPAFNFPTFFAAAEDLRDRGFDVRSPAEHDVDTGFDYNDPKAWENLTNEQRAEAFSWDVQSVLWCDAVVVLPGWRHSQGVGVELGVARAIHRSIVEFSTMKEVVEEDPMEEAARLIHGERQGVYGHPFEDFSKTASLWSPILGVSVTPEQVALCMLQVKISRLLQSPDHRDSLVDTHGYLGTYKMVRDYRQQLVA